MVILLIPLMQKLEKKMSILPMVPHLVRSRGMSLENQVPESIPFWLYLHYISFQLYLGTFCKFYVVGTIVSILHTLFNLYNKSV